MAGRPTKAGLDYFELDCHMEEKVRLIQAEFGLKWIEYKVARKGAERNGGVVIGQQSNTKQCIQFGGRICKVASGGSESSWTSKSTSNLGVR